MTLMGKIEVLDFEMSTAFLVKRKDHKIFRSSCR